MDRLHDPKPNLRAINTGRHAQPAASSAELQSVSLNGGIGSSSKSLNGGISSSGRRVTEDGETPTSARSTAIHLNVHKRTSTASASGAASGVTPKNTGHQPEPSEPKPYDPKLHSSSHSGLPQLYHGSAGGGNAAVLTSGSQDELHFKPQLPKHSLEQQHGNVPLPLQVASVNMAGETTTPDLVLTMGSPAAANSKLQQQSGLSVLGTTFNQAPRQQQQHGVSGDARDAVASRSSSASTMSRANTTSLTVYGANSLALHYFSSQKNLDVTSLASGLELPAEKQQPQDSDVAPPRIFVHTKMHIIAVTTAGLVAVLVLSYWSIITKILQLQQWYALVVLLIVPVGAYFFSFAVNTAVCGVFSIFLGGTSPLDMNTQNYSALKTPIPRGAKLPQIIVQMPVYTESLEEVIQLSYHNVKKAMDLYVSKGGRAKFLVCDDGYQGRFSCEVISPEEAAARTAFYAKHDIAYVGRPAGNRRGTFKKASNLNYQLAISQLINALVKQQPGMSPEDALTIVWEDWGREFVAAGDLTMEDDCIILLIDADTKVPEACMYDTVGEFLQCPEVAYTQHYTTPFDEQCRNYWEAHVSAFTRTIYMQGIAVSTAFGDTAPLVGHNAFLRWSALTSIGYTDETCRTAEVKYWGEDSVSEDFDMYIRLASVGSFGRYVMYTGTEFQEGVSLTYMDEVIKFKKFAYGACELLFNPLKQWPTKGPFNKKFKLYLRNPAIKWYQKISMCAYLSSYQAMASAFIFSVIEGMMSIVDPGWHDKYMMRSFDIMLTCTVVFAGIGTFCNGVFYQWRRLGHDQHPNIFRIIWDNVKWIPTTTLFFGSVLFPVTEVCFMYFFSRKVSWGATAKATTNKSCFQAIKETLVGYKWEYATYFTLLLGYSFCLWYFKVGMYRGWSITSFCVSHILGPILLNPTIMSLKW